MGKNEKLSLNDLKASDEGLNEEEHIKLLKEKIAQKKERNSNFRKMKLKDAAPEGRMREKTNKMNIERELEEQEAEREARIKQDLVKKFGEEKGGKLYKQNQKVKERIKKTKEKVKNRKKKSENKI